MSTISSALSSIFSPVSVESGNSSSNSSSSNSSSNSSGTASTGTSNSGSSSSGFLGASQYSNTLSSEVSREIQIANLPIELLTNQQNALNSQATEMSNIDGLVSTLQSAVQGIQNAMDGSSYDAAVMDSSGMTSQAIQPALSDSAQEGVYSMTVNSIGSYAGGVTSSNWSSPSTGVSYHLQINGQSYAITTTDNTASGIAAAINQQYGDVVQASVLNYSPTDTRIALQATSLGAQTIDLQDAHNTSLLTQNVGGSQAEYTVTGGQPVFTNSRSVQISPGVNVLMQATTSSPVNITVSRSDSALSDALSSFAKAYNDVVDAVTAQHGQSAGPLQGNPILTTISNTLNQLGLYSSNSGTVSSLYNLGLELNANGNMNGHLTFNAFNLAAEDIGNSKDVDSFLGDSSSGFVQLANSLLSDLENPSSGLLKNAESSLQTQITHLGNSISTKQDQVTQLQTNLTNQMAKADSLISMMEQQFSYMNEMFQAQQVEGQQYANM